MLWWTLAMSAHAFDVMTNDGGLSMSWSDMPVHYEIDPADAPEELDREGVLAATRLAAEAWNGVSWSGVDYVEGAEVDWTGAVVGPVVGRVWWDREWAWDTDALALASTWSTESGEIVAFEIAVNNGPGQTWTLGGEQGWDVQNALTHEFGHVLGLAHETGIAEATMFPTAREGETIKRDLDPDDEDGARWLYPDPNASLQMPLPVFLACDARGAAPAPALLPLALLLLRRRSR